MVKKKGLDAKYFKVIGQHFYVQNTCIQVHLKEYICSIYSKYKKDIHFQSYIVRIFLILYFICYMLPTYVIYKCQYHTLLPSKSAPYKIVLLAPTHGVIHILLDFL